MGGEHAPRRLRRRARDAAPHARPGRPPSAGDSLPRAERALRPRGLGSSLGWLRSASGPAGRPARPRRGLRRFEKKPGPRPARAQPSIAQLAERRTVGRRGVDIFTSLVRLRLEGRARRFCAVGEATATPGGLALPARGRKPFGTPASSAAGVPPPRQHPGPSWGRGPPRALRRSGCARLQSRLGAARSHALGTGPPHAPYRARLRLRTSRWPERVCLPPACAADKRTGPPMGQGAPRLPSGQLSLSSWGRLLLGLRGWSPLVSPSRRLSVCLSVSFPVFQVV